MAVDIGSAVGYLDLDISGFLKGLESAQSKASKETKNIATTIGTNLSSVGKNIASVGTTLSKGITTPIVGVGTAIVKMSSDFEAAMSKVQAISGASSEDFNMLKTEAQRLGATTAWSASEVAEGMTEMAKAGWSSQQIMDGMSGVLNAASASGENLASVSTIVADAITGFGLEASDATKVADLLTQAANAGTIDISDLGESFKYIAPMAASMGISIEDATTAMAAMSMAGIKGSQAGTSLRTMLARMVKPTDAVAGAMSELGIVLTNEDGTFKSLDTIVAEMRGSFSGLTDEQKTYYATILAGQEGMSGLLSLLNLTQEEYDAISDSMKNANGVAEETANVMLDNLQGQITILKSALEGLAIQFGDAILPYLKQFVTWLQNATEKLQQMSPEQKQQIVKWAALAAAIGPVLVAFSKLVSGLGGVFTMLGKIPGVVSSVTGGMTKLVIGFKNIGEGITLAKAGFPRFAEQASKLGAAIEGITAPVAAVIAIIALLVAAFVHLWKTNDEFRSKMIAVWDGVKSKIEESIQKIADAINSLGLDFESLGKAISAAWDWICNALEPIISEIFASIGRVIGGVVDLVTGTVQTIVGIIKGFKDDDWSLFLEGLKTLWDGCLAILSSQFVAVFNVIKSYLEKFGISWEEIWTTMKTFFVGVWEGIKSFFIGAVTSIQTVATTVFTAMSSFFTTIWNAIESVFGTVVNAIVQLVTDAWNNIYNVISTVFTSVSTFISTIWNAIFTAISTIVTEIWNNIKTVFNGILLSITKIVSSISNVISNIFNAIKEFLRGNTEEAEELIRQAWQTAYDHVNAIVTEMLNTISTVFTAIKTAIQTVMRTVQTNITTVWNAIKTIVTSVVNGLKTAITTVFIGIRTTIQTIMQAIQTFMTSYWNAIKTAVLNVANEIKTAVSTTFINMKSSVVNTVNALKTDITNVFNGIKTAISNAVNTAKQNAINAMTDAKNGMVNVFNNIGATFRNIGRNAIQGIINGIGDMVGDLYDSIEDALSDLVDEAKDALGIASPSKVFKQEVGKWIPLGIASGFSAAMPEAVKRMQKDLDGMTDDLSDNQVNIGVVDNMTSAFNTVAEYFESIENRLVESVQNMKASLEYLINSGQAIVGTEGSLSYVGYDGMTRTADKQPVVTTAQPDVASRTYVFYTTKAINEIEAAKQIKRTERDIAEGFI